MIEKINEIDIDVFSVLATAYREFEFCIKLSIKRLQYDFGIDSRLLGDCFGNVKPTWIS